MNEAPGLSAEELQRYARHLTLPEVGAAGQRRLRQGSVLLVGAGGLGSPAALYLAAAGVGRLGIVEPDAVELSNLQRQVLHGGAALGRAKLESARARLADLNPHVRLDGYPLRLAAANALPILRAYDVVLDCSDNFATRYLVNDACVLLGKPLVYGAVHRFEGQASVFQVGRGPCYRCLFPQPPPAGTVPNCAEAGVLGVLPGLVGCLQALEALKLLLGVGEPLLGRLLLCDGLGLRFHEIRFARDPQCPACGERPTIRSLRDEPALCDALPAHPEEGMDHTVPELTAGELKARLDRGDALTIVDVREHYEWGLGNLGDYGARLLPLSELAERLDELDPDAETVLVCRSGGRSARALEFLRAEGFGRLWNLKGGMHAWADAVDPGMPKY